MKLTKTKLKQIIRETMIQRQSGLSDIMSQLGGYDIEDDAEYARGYQHGWSGYSIELNATSDYDVGYKEGQDDARTSSRTRPADHQHPPARISGISESITKQQLRRVIREDIEKYFDEFRQYTTKGAWVLKSLGEDAYYVRMRYHPYLEPVWGTREEAKTFDNELEAKVRKDIIEKDDPSGGIQVTVENVSEELEEAKKKSSQVKKV